MSNSRVLLDKKVSTIKKLSNREVLKDKISNLNKKCPIARSLLDKKVPTVKKLSNRTLLKDKISNLREKLSNSGTPIGQNNQIFLK